MDTDTPPPTPGDLKVWWIPQVPMTAFEVPVPDVRTGWFLCDVLADYDRFQYEHNVKPDYSNMGGVTRWETDGEDGFGWYDVDDEGIAAAAADPTVVLDGIPREYPNYTNEVIDLIKARYLTAHPEIDPDGTNWAGFNLYIEQLREVGFLSS